MQKLQGVYASAAWLFALALLEFLPPACVSNDEPPTGVLVRMSRGSNRQRSSAFVLSCPPTVGLRLPQKVLPPEPLANFVFLQSSEESNLIYTNFDLHKSAPKVHLFLC
eukprot:Gregarina_sp_Poly_1__10647@NODE_7_length_24424_cov_76_286365_g6_i0_p21_GENE_NODE_7_length_24424_cov_76_286365_g6_i0NODE_7_length_24424_cov_76_286365_g6_i0_p21_ORF_typecomplete_len109_score14_00_NODE_7_length_24424_cov_76_286365_g6_i01360613932